MTVETAAPTLPLASSRVSAIRARAARTPGTPEGRAIRDLLGEVNRLRAALARAVKQPNPLTAGEMAALIGAARAESAQQTGQRLGASHHTIRTQRQHALRRLKANTLAQAVAIACVNGWITHEDLNPKGDQR
ncbi:hypothetical protein [Streptomyces vilmorinianum]|uniref:hypothetical protein n=1 Tax=Streptomyces vilmorinianum TaxID=3051092 RepID=UPI0010FB24B8|nr:hypothetical protein [Streptomyces vilmorinianum]